MVASLEPPANVVFMGMGEPFDNLEEVLRAVEVLTALPLPGVAPRRITVSTSGVLTGIRPFLARSKAELALSLHAAGNEQRAEIVPHTSRWPIESLLREAREALKGDRRLLFEEYLLIGGFNDAEEDAARLARLLESVPCRINLIPFNPVPGLPFSEPSAERVSCFASTLSSAGYRVLSRRPRGRDVGAACGQLAGAYTL